MAIVMVQAPTPTIVPTVVSSTIAYASNVTAGNVLVVYARAQGILPNSISDNLANSGTWVPLSGSFGTADKYVWGKLLTASGALTVTITGSSGTIRIAAYEHSGVDFGTAFTYCGISTQVGTTASMSTLPLNPGTLVIAGIAGGIASDVVTAGGSAPNSDFSTLNNASGHISLEDSVNWAGGVATPTFNLSITETNAHMFVIGSLLLPSVTLGLSRRPVPMIQGPDTDQILRLRG